MTQLVDLLASEEVVYGTASYSLVDSPTIMTQGEPKWSK